MAKWRLDKTEPRTDGTGKIAFDIWGVTDTGVPIPGKHTTILIDSAAVQAALALATNALRNARLKTLIAEQLPTAEWSAAELDRAILANASAATIDTSLDTYVTASLSGYPVTFSL